MAQDHGIQAVIIVSQTLVSESLGLFFFAYQNLTGRGC